MKETVGGEADALLTALDDLERELRQLGYWSESPPPAAALRSSLPFCYDTLNFLQWLQWVFLPRMRITIRERGSPAAKCVVKPAAEVYFASRHAESGSLQQLLGKIDELASRHWAQNTDPIPSRRAH